MFERYTERARRVIFSAKYIAHESGSPEIETEHLLFGLLREDQSLGNRFLGSPWVLESIWAQVAQSKPVREKHAGPVDLKLSTVSKHVLALAADEAGRLSNRYIGTEHLLLGLLREQSCFAAEMLHERGVSLVMTREELTRTRHDDSVHEKFVRESGSSPEVAQLKAQIERIMGQMKEAISQRDFAKARVYSDEERKTREKLQQLCKQQGLFDWLYD
jgi:ATP-dependent Clp protease ATP-binding subunit ClpC